MHELSVTQKILSICLREAEKNNSKSICRINIKVGELTGLVPAYITEYFKVVAKYTIASEAEISISKVRVAIKCEGCGFEGEIGEGKYNCPACNSNKFKITNGREYYVESIEVDE